MTRRQWLKGDGSQCTIESVCPSRAETTNPVEKESSQSLGLVSEDSQGPVPAPYQFYP